MPLRTAQLQSSSNSLHRFITYMLLAVVVPGQLLALALAWRSAQQLITGQEQEAARLASAAAQSMGNHLGTMTASIAVLAQMPLGGKHLADFHRVATAYSAQAGFHVTLGDGDGNQFLSTRLPFGAQPPRRSAMDSVHKAVASGRPHASEVFSGRMAGRHVITIDAAVQTPDGLRIITLSSDAAAISEALLRTQLPAGWLLGLIDGRGAFIARSKDQERWTGKPTQPELIEAARRAESGILDNRSVEGFRILNAYQRVPGTDWTVLVGIPKTVLYGPLAWPLAALAGLMVGIIGLTIILARALTRRLDAATGQLIRLAHDPLRSRDQLLTPESSFAELDDIAHVLTAAAQEQRQLILNLRLSDERFRRLFRHAPVPMAIVQENGTMAAFNESFSQLFGYTLTDVPTLAEWWPRAYPDRDYRAWARKSWDAAVALATEQNTEIEAAEYHITCKDGTARTVVVSGMVVGTDLLATLFDVTQRKQAENEVRKLNAELEIRVAARTDELEKANQQLRSFSYTVAHDLRAPLRGINGFSAMLLEDADGRLDEETISNLRRIHEAGKRMSALIDDLLKLTNVSQQPMLWHDINLSEAAEAIMTSLRAAQPGRAVSVTIQPELHANGDAGLLHDALENLLGNAWKFTQKAADAAIGFGAEQRGDDIVYSVSDNGAGFDMKFAHKLFTPFERLHRRDEFDGTGIGLASVRNIIERHHGKIWLDSTVNRGTTVFFTLGKPAESACENSAHAGTSPG